MGHQATVVIHLDALNTISKDPKFGKKLSDAILQKANHRPSGDITISFNASSDRCSTNAGVVVEVHHSGYSVLVETGQNTGRIVNKMKR